MILITASIVLLIMLLIGIVTIVSLSKEQEEEEIEEIDVEQLEMNFGEMFNNQEHEYVSTLYSIQEEKSGKYKVEVDIPYIKVEDKIDNQINQEINEIFVNKLLKVINESESYTILTIDYTTSINENIMSLAIKCVLKEAHNAQRTIIKTYNYDIENGRILKITDLIPENKKQYIQNEIDIKIQKQIKKENTIAEQGYNIYRRNPDSDIYKLENATEFYLKDNILYIIYSYGNSNYTSEVDLIISTI